MDILIPLLVIAFLICVNGLFVAAEFAIASVPHTRITQMAESGSAAAQHVAQILKTPDLLNRYISTAQVGITIASLGLGMYGEEVVAEWLVEPLHHGWFALGDTAAHTVATIIAVAILTYLHVVVGEMVPKSLALMSPDTTAVALSTTMTWTERIFNPLTSVLNWIGDTLLRLAGMPPASAESNLTSSEELAYIVEESFEGGLLDPTEQLYLENVLDFSDRTLGQVVTPRTSIVGIPVESTYTEVLDTVCDNRYSRYPVYEDDLDHIIGVLYIKDLARYMTGTNGEKTESAPTPNAVTDLSAHFNLHTLMREPVIVPETLSLEQLLVQFREGHVQIAVVVDEFGGTDGIVTLEDLVEELIGEIQDEFDEEEIQPIEELAPDLLRVRGDLLLDELNQLYDLALEHDEVDTVGGLVMDELEHVPEPGEQVSYGGATFTVETVDHLRVNTVIVDMKRVES
ncbi:MAG: hemolysin family protein [Chloroflexota bacterium]